MSFHLVIQRFSFSICLTCSSLTWFNEEKLISNSLSDTYTTPCTKNNIIEYYHQWEKKSICYTLQHNRNFNKLSSSVLLGRVHSLYVTISLRCLLVMQKNSYLALMENECSMCGGEKNGVTVKPRRSGTT